MSVARLAELVRTRQPVVVLTGAGVSTESGIPDFRSPGGLWAEFDPMDYATIDAFRRDPEKIWAFYSRRFRFLAEAVPNAAHHALAELEGDGLLQAVITQNIDRLHSRAGSREVVEVHGSISTAVCLACGAEETLDAVLAQLEERPAPLCPVCNTVLKPGVVMFGELLPSAAIERATALAQEAGLLLVIGSSLEVWPVAGLPLEARSYGIVNRGPTALDDGAAIVIDADAGEALSELARTLL